MARIIEPTPEQAEGYRAWVAGLDAHVRAVAERFDPWSLYRLKPSNHRVTIVSFGEAEDQSVTLTVCVSGDWNAVMFERNVFGIKPEDLEPCELPGPDEPTGAILHGDEVTDHLDLLRALAGITVKH